jgi:hypothetical protein
MRSSSKVSREVDNLKDGPSITILSTMLMYWQIAVQYEQKLLLRGFEWRGSTLHLIAIPDDRDEIEVGSLHWKKAIS